MNTITESDGLADRSIAPPTSADVDRPSARSRVEAQLPRDGDDDRDDSVVVWNGMVARFPARHRRSPTSSRARPVA